MRKYVMSPVASTTVVMNGAETTAGSTPALLARIGMTAPTVVASAHTAMSERHSTVAICASTRSHAGTKPTTARTTPSDSPVPSSRNATRGASRTEISPADRERTTVVTVWAPALPPVPMSSGTNRASATTCSSVDSK